MWETIHGLAPAPFCVVSLFSLLAKRKIWPGDLRVVAVAVFLSVVVLFHGLPRL